MEEKTITFIVGDEPRGQQRPRFVRKTGTAYKPKEDRAYEQNVREAYLQTEGAEMFYGAVAIYITAYYKIPSSAPKSAKLAMEDGTRLPTKKPDLDNIIKIINDGLKGAAFEDDKQVVRITAEKMYAEDPYVLVSVQEV